MSDYKNSLNLLKQKKIKKNPSWSVLGGLFLAKDGPPNLIISIHLTCTEHERLPMNKTTMKNFSETTPNHTRNYLNWDFRVQPQDQLPFQIKKQTQRIMENQLQR